MNTFLFSDTTEAYDSTQCDDRIKDGDVLVIADEGVVGICHTWPIAVTAESGSLHQIAFITGIEMARVLGLSYEQMLTSLRAAVATAEHQGWDIAPQIAAVLAAA
ncbi:hypothetical protein [Nevskia sp.]|uniref:hypothetical protein n=1 Tax=Nevskia sp. TaxID=1929292 RepID=UPI0025E0CEE2|nr:hypothetical protein [Nevskia sp.]